MAASWIFFIAASFDSTLSRCTLGSPQRESRLALVPVSAVLYFFIVCRAFLSLSIAIEVAMDRASWSDVPFGV